MKTRDFSFNLPEELIAQEPPRERGASRLMVLDSRTGTTADSTIRRLADHLDPGTVVVLNDTRVRKARLFGTAEDTGGRVELLLLEEAGAGTWQVLASRSRKVRPGRIYRFPGGVLGEVVGTAGESGELRRIRFQPPLTEAWLEEHGHIPLPPYIRRQDAPEDEERYQTIYARLSGSAAAPTAGLHLTGEILEELRARDMEIAFVTLHVGLGTFLPVRTERVEDHVMHAERYFIPEDTAWRVERARRQGREVLGVGTTVVRALESAWRREAGARQAAAGAPGPGSLAVGWGETRLYIYPGYRFQVVTRMLTNFHVPGSSLLLLVSAFAGREAVLRAYAEAVEKRYRFFSYGDAMLIR